MISHLFFIFNRKTFNSSNFGKFSQIIYTLSLMENFMGSDAMFFIYHSQKKNTEILQMKTKHRINLKFPLVQNVITFYFIFWYSLSDFSLFEFLCIFFSFNLGNPLWCGCYSFYWNTKSFFNESQIQFTRHIFFFFRKA